MNDLVILQLDVRARQVFENGVADLQAVATLNLALADRMRVVVDERAIGGGEVHDEQVAGTLFQTGVAAGDAVARQDDVVVTTATDRRRIPVQHEASTEIALNGRMYDDQTGFPRPPDPQFIEPGDSGLYIVIYVHGVQDYLCAGQIVQPTNGVTKLQLHSVIKELASPVLWCVIARTSCTRRTCQLVTNFDISASAVSDSVGFSTDRSVPHGM